MRFKILIAALFMLLPSMAMAQSQYPANTVWGNPLNALAFPKTIAMPSCSGASNALTYTSGTGFTCSSSVSPSGAAGGDLSGTYPNPTVAKINGVALGSTTATSGNILIASGTAWVTNGITGDITLNSTGVVGVTKINGATLGSTTATSGNVLIGSGTQWVTNGITGDASVTAGGSWTNSKVNGVSYPPGPSINTVPVVTGANTATYEAVPAAALAPIPGLTVLGNGGTSSVAPSAIAARIQLTANTNFYVRTDGNDSACTGLTNAAYVSGSYPQACAWATPQKASDVLHASYDLAGFQVTVTIVTGTYSSASYVLNVNGPYTGASPTDPGYPGPNTCPVIFKGSTGTATDVTLTSTLADAVLGANGAVFCVQDMTLTATVGSDLHLGAAFVNYGNIIFGAAGRSWIWSGHLSLPENYSSFAVAGNAPNGFEFSPESAIYFTSGTTINIAANVTVTCFVTGDGASELTANTVTIALNAHTVTGQRFCLKNGAAVRGTGQSLTYFPGSIGGSIDLSSSYDDMNLVTGGTAAGSGVTIQSTSNASPSGDFVWLKASNINLGWTNLATLVNVGAAGFGGAFQVSGSTSGAQTWKPAAVASGTITWPAGTTDFSVTGGTEQYVKQASAGGPFTVARPTCSSLSDSQTGCSTVYATGTWTPTLLGSSTAGTPTYTIQTGSYEHMGVTWRAVFTVQVTSLGGATGNLLIGGLPFTQANVTNDYGQCFMLDWIGWTGDTGYTVLTAFVQPNQNQAQLFENGSGKSGQQTPVTNYAASTLLVGMCFGHT